MRGIGIEVITASAILFAFATGVLIGVVLVISLASVFEDWGWSLWDVAPNAMCRGARRLMGAPAGGGRPFSGSPPSVPREPNGPDRKDRPGWEEPPGIEVDDTQPRWPGGASA